MIWKQKPYFWSFLQNKTRFFRKSPSFGKSRRFDREAFDSVEPLHGCNYLLYTIRTSNKLCTTAFFFVKQGFTQNHSALVPEEYGSLVSKADSSTAVVNSKVLSDLKSIMSKKEDLNTLADSGKDSGK